MKDLNKIVDLIIKELFDLKDEGSSEQKVLMQLLESGIDLEEIDKAFCFIVKKIHQNNQNKNKKIKKMRVLTAQEKFRLSKDAQACLYDYYYNDSITWQEMERVINNVEKMNQVLDVSDLNMLIEKIIFAKKHENIMVCGLDVH